MLYLLLYPLHKYYSGFNALRYETLRSVLAGLAALALSLALGPHSDRTVSRAAYRSDDSRGGSAGASEESRHADDGRSADRGVDARRRRCCSPTSCNPVRLDRDLRDAGFGAIGFTDDYFKLTRGKGLGLSGPVKLAWSFSCAFIAAAWLFLYLGFDTHLTVPFLKNVHPDLHWWFYIPFAMARDRGMLACGEPDRRADGLAIGPVMTVAFTYWTFTYVAGNIKFASYLQVPYIANVGEVAIFCASVIAASLGFLWFNAYPASMMMGDVGALALGGALGTVAVLAKQEFALPIAGGVFVIEAVSAIIQRYYFKATHRRVFRMAPLHHHFELAGIPETVVVIRFWIVSIVCGLVALSTLKLR